MTGIVFIEATPEYPVKGGQKIAINVASIVAVYETKRGCVISTDRTDYPVLEPYTEVTSRMRAGR